MTFLILVVAHVCVYPFLRSHVIRLQRLAFKTFPETLKDFALSNVGSIDTRDTLTEHLSVLTDVQLHHLASLLHLIEPLPTPATDNTMNDQKDQTTEKRGLIMELLIFKYERRLSQIEALNDMPLYPTEQILWDENIVPTEMYNDGCLALPKLNVQFLTMHDYLLRNLNLFRLESTYEIRQDMEDIIPRMKPYTNNLGETQFTGWSRMAQPITGFTIIEMGKPNIGETRPSSVRADIQVHLNVREHIRDEWDRMRKHDVGFLVSVRPPYNDTKKDNSKRPFVKQFGITSIRGCEVEGILNDKGVIIEEHLNDEDKKLKGNDRTYRVWLDCNQYQSDLTNKDDVYGTFNLFMRRNPKENNFKAVLETIRDLMNTNAVVPQWLNDVFLGYVYDTISALFCCV